MKTTTKAIFLLTLAFLSACANIHTVKIPQDYIRAESEIAIAPIELSGNLYLSPSGWGMLFGAAGVVIEHTATASKREAQAQTIKDAWGDWRPEMVLSDKIAEELIKRGKDVIQRDEIIPLPANIQNKSAASRFWYNPDNTIFDHSTIMNHYSPTAIMEAGYEEPAIIGHRVIFVILIKVVDPRTNNVIARRRVVARMATGRYKLKDPSQLQQYVAEFKTNFENAVAKAVPKMLDDIGL